MRNSTNFIGFLYKMIVNFHKILLVKIQSCMIFLIVFFDFILVIIFS